MKEERPAIEGEPLGIKSDSADIAKNNISVAVQDSKRNADKPLNFRRTVAAGTVAKLFGLPPQRNASRAAARNAIITCVSLAGETGMGVSYSRRKGYYVA